MVSYLTESMSPLYVGSTTLTLRKRLQCHFNEVKDLSRTDKKNECMQKYGINNWEIILVKEVICTKRERIREHVINMLFPSLNERVACTGINIDKKFDNTEYFRKYYKIN